LAREPGTFAAHSTSPRVVQVTPGIDGLTARTSAPAAAAFGGRQGIVAGARIGRYAHVARWHAFQGRRSGASDFLGPARHALPIW
jgi:hypothetical protein